MARRYPRSVKPNYGLDLGNVYAADLGTPALASTNRVVTDHAMSRTAMTIANASSADGLPRNVTVTATQAGGVDDTAATATITGTDVLGRTITEDIVPLNGSTVAGAKAFKTVTGSVQSAWVAGGTADRLVVGFGTLVGFADEAILREPAVASGAQVIGVLFDGALVQASLAFNAAVFEENTVDASASTYNGTKRLTALIRR